MGREIKELLQPRYKVIADYPHSVFSLGQVIELKESRIAGFRYEWAEHDGIHWEPKSFFDEYPHLFKKLEWWEERKVEDMPEYVRTDGAIFKVKLYYLNSSVPMVYFSPESPYNAAVLKAQVFPATKEEYEQYQKLKQ